MVGVGEHLQQLVERTVAGLGYELVDLERAGGGLLRVTLDAPGAVGGIGVEDCERVSHQLTRLFAVEEIDYERLEVSSPGLDRRLSRVQDFERFSGQNVQVQLKEAINGRRRLRGRLLGVSGPPGAEQIALELASATVTPPRKAGPKGKALDKTKAGVAVPPEVVQVALAAIDRARLVPDVHFGSKQ